MMYSGGLTISPLILKWPKRHFTYPQRKAHRDSWPIYKYYDENDDVLTFEIMTIY